MRVLIVDDQEFIRRGIRAILSDEKDIQVCGEASDGRDALAKGLELRPDVTIMDVGMPRMDGIEATRLLRLALPEMRILTLTQYDRPEVMAAAQNAGSAAFVSKLWLWDKLVSSLRRVHLGETFFEKHETELS